MGRSKEGGRQQRREREREKERVKKTERGEKPWKHPQLNEKANIIDRF